jgi:hypothetical protein
LNGKEYPRFLVLFVICPIVSIVGISSFLYYSHKTTKLVEQDDEALQGAHISTVGSDINTWSSEKSVTGVQKKSKFVGGLGESSVKQWTYKGGPISYSELQTRVGGFYEVPSSHSQLDLTLNCTGREKLLRSHVDSLQKVLETRDINAIDISDVRFMTDNSLTRQEKIAVYLYLLEQQRDPFLFSLIIDGIQPLYPIELAKAVIPLYDNFSEFEAKQKILQLLSRSTEIANEPDKLSVAQLDFIAEQKGAAQGLFVKVMYDSTIPEAAREAFISSPWVVDPQDMMKVLQQIEDKDPSLQHMHEALTQSDYDDVWVRTIFANEEMQNTYVPGVLSKLQTLVKNRSEGAIRLYHYLPLYGQSLDQNSKGVLLGTLMQHKPPMVSSDIVFPEWLEAVAALSSTTKAESRRYVEDYIMAASPQEVAHYLTSNPAESNGFIAALQEEERRQLTRKMHLELKQNARDRSWDSTYRWALKVLKQR